MRLPRLLPTILLLSCLVLAVPAAAQDPHPPQPTPNAAVPKGAQPAPATEEHAATDHHLMDSVFRFLNFAILAGAVFYFLRAPIAGYLSSRSSQIRQDLVTASEMRAAATAQLAEIERRMQALPGELDALRRQGAEDLEAERARLARAATEERARLLEQTRRELDMRLRIARRELTEHAAMLAVGVAEQRIRRSITSEDQIRLVDRYASQLREAR